MRILELIRHRFAKYVTMNASENSVVFSPALLRYLRRHTDKDLHVLTLGLANSSVNDGYGFIVAPGFEDLSEDVKLPTIQYNSKDKEYGYNCFNPSVALIAYKWGLEHDAVWQSKVTVQDLAGQKLYIINRP